MSDFMDIVVELLPTTNAKDNIEVGDHYLSYCYNKTLDMDKLRNLINVCHNYHYDLEINCDDEAYFVLKFTKVT